MISAELELTILKARQPAYRREVPIVIEPIDSYLGGESGAYKRAGKADETASRHAQYRRRSDGRCVRSESLIDSCGQLRVPIPAVFGR